MSDRLALWAARVCAGALLVFLVLGGLVLWCTLVTWEGVERIARRT